MPLHYRKDEGFRLKCILSHNRDLILVQVALVQHVCLHWHLFLKGFFFLMNNWPLTIIFLWTSSKRLWALITLLVIHIKNIFSCNLVRVLVYVFEVMSFCKSKEGKSYTRHSDMCSIFSLLKKEKLVNVWMP